MAAAVKIEVEFHGNIIIWASLVEEERLIAASTCPNALEQELRVQIERVVSEERCEYDCKASKAKKKASSKGPADFPATKETVADKTPAALVC